MTKGAIDVPDPVAPAPAPRPSFWLRQLPHYPRNRARAIYLGIVVVITIQLYYELYVGGSVGPQIIAQFNFTLSNFVLIAIIGNAVGAFASVAAGLADRFGRANLVLGGLLLTVLLILFGIPNVHNKIQYMAVAIAISFVEGTVLVATPALIRDFSPQLGRASAMGFWTLGPVIGSLVVTEISSHTLLTHPDWRFQFRLCGVIGLVVFVIAFAGLRELAPRLRDQIMVSIRDRMLIEARAAGIDERAMLRGSWRQMMARDVTLPALAISVFLLFYYVLVGFFVIYYVLTFGYSSARANSLANWYWAANAISLVVAGVVSDRLRVRKPLMVVGALVSAVGVALFAVYTTHPGTTYYTFAAILVVIAAGGGVAYCGWMAAFTETVEKHNPAAIATGLAVWGGILRCVVSVSLIGVVLAVPSAGVLVDHGTQVQTLSAKYSTQLTTLQAVDAGTLAKLAANPLDLAAGQSAVTQIMSKLNLGATEATNRLVAAGQVPKEDLAYLRAHGPEVLAAQRKSPHEWQRWWWVCFAAQLFFIPFTFLLIGRWSPRRAAADARAHAEAVDRELAQLAGERTNA